MSSAELIEQLRGSEHQMPSIHEFSSRNWDVFDAHGRYLGVLRLPPGFQLIGIHDTRLLGIWRNEFDVEHVNVLSLEAA